MNKAAFPEMYFFEKEKAQNVYISKHNFKNIKPHSHEYYELEYFYEGSGVCEINGNKITVYADSYARFVEIYSPDSDFILSDNYFDMNAGEKTVEILEGTPKTIVLRSVYDIK